VITVSGILPPGRRTYSLILRASSLGGSAFHTFRLVSVLIQVPAEKLAWREYVADVDLAEAAYHPAEAAYRLADKGETLLPLDREQSIVYQIMIHPHSL
jgi:hypothetical protein